MNDIEESRQTADGWIADPQSIPPNLPPSDQTRATRDQLLADLIADLNELGDSTDDERIEGLEELRTANQTPTVTGEVCTQTLVQRVAPPMPLKSHEPIDPASLPPSTEFAPYKAPPMPLLPSKGVNHAPKN